MVQQAWKALSQFLTWPNDSLYAGILGQQLSHIQVPQEMTEVK